MSIVFHDFISARGENVIHAWLHGLGVKERQKINSIIEHLESEKNLSGSPFTHKMDVTDHIFEVIADARGKAFRPLYFYGPEKGQATLVIGTEKKNDRLIPANAIETAEKRRELVLTKRNETVEHDIS